MHVRILMVAGSALPHEKIFIKVLESITKTDLLNFTVPEAHAEA